MSDFSNITVQNLDHLGIVAGLVDEIGIVEIVNQALGINSQEQITKGQVVKAMILNGLGFVSQPLYLFSHFFDDKPIEQLLGKNIKSEYLNDDKLGRVLDQLFEYGLTDLFLEIVISTIKKFKINVDYSHLDSSSFHLHGQYPNQQLNSEKSSSTESQEQRKTIFITRGYSRDHRPDLKQFVLNLIASSDSEIPTFMMSGDGNQSDKKEFATLAVKYHQQMKSVINQETTMICDSSLYSQENIQILGEIPWITRVPATIKQAQEMMETESLEISEEEKTETKEEEKELIKQLTEKGYKWKTVESNYGAIAQRWLLVESQSRKKSDLEKIEQKIPLEEKELMKIIKKIEQKEWCEIKEYRKEINQRNKKLKYWQIEEKERLEISQKKAKRIKYKVKVKISKKELIIERKKREAGRFILATNILEKEKLADSEILAKYKEQQNVERGFRFLKTPSFFAESFYVNKVERIEGILWLMAICLLVYNLGQRELRKTLKRVKHGIKNQVGKKTEQPTLRWIFQCFQGIHIVKIEGKKQVVNVSKDREEILRYLPLECQKYY
jgi:transposase